MELKTFIQQSLIDIASAIEDANKDTSTDMIVNPNKIICAGEADQRITKDAGGWGHADMRFVQTIKFDVAVTVGNSTTDAQEKNINVAGSTVGESEGTTDEQSTASRIRFELPIALPHGRY